MQQLKYLSAYPETLQEKVRQMIAQNSLGEHLAQKYPQRHLVQTDRALYTYATELKQSFMRNAPALHKVGYDTRLDVEHHALGLHTAISRVQGGKLKAKKEIRIAYRLCESMQPGYGQLEFDLRLYLTWRELA